MNLTDGEDARTAKATAELDVSCCRTASVTVWFCNDVASQDVAAFLQFF